MKKNSNISVDSLKEDARTYTRLEEENANGWEWYSTCAIGNLLQDEKVTLAYIKQQSKQEFDITVSLSQEIMRKFKSKEIALAFSEKYKEIYTNIKDEDNFYENEILPLMEVKTEEL